MPPKETEDALFFEAVKDVKKLPSEELPPRRLPHPRVGVDGDPKVLAQLEELTQGVVSFEISDTGEYREGIAQGIDHKHLRKLRQGDYAVQRHLDLHGLTQKEARAAVAKFLEEARRQGWRCVLLIHGRGRRSEKGPVLKESVGHWLTHGRLGRMVMAFATARPSDGGAGAMYVLLRR